jgi:hypothetical protein
MREKALEMVDMLVGPFENMLANIAVHETGENGLLPDDQLPQPLVELRNFIREQLTAARSGYEDAIAEVVAQYLTEGEVDTVLAFNKSEAGQKMRVGSRLMQRDFMIASAKWRNAVLEAHQGKMKILLGVVEPAPAPIPEARTEKVSETEGSDDGWKEIDATPDDAA